MNTKLDAYTKLDTYATRPHAGSMLVHVRRVARALAHRAAHQERMMLDADSAQVISAGRPFSWLVIFTAFWRDGNQCSVTVNVRKEADGMVYARTSFLNDAFYFDPVEFLCKLDEPRPRPQSMAVSDAVFANWQRDGKLAQYERQDPAKVRPDGAMPPAEELSEVL